MVTHGVTTSRERRASTRRPRRRRRNAPLAEDRASRMAQNLLSVSRMTRSLPAVLSALALLALPGCACEVIVADPDMPNFGIFSISQSPPNQVNAGAGFYKGVPQSRREEIARDGACWLEHYALPVSSPQLLPVDAGELRVTGGLTDLTTDFESGYDFQEKGAIFKAGDVLTLHVEGSDEIAPMSVTLPAPPTPVIAPPPATLDIGEDLTFTWTSPPGIGTLQFYVQVSWDAVKTDYSSAVYFPRDIVRCTADISQGTLTMPASLLSQLSTSGPRKSVV